MGDVTRERFDANGEQIVIHFKHEPTDTTYGKHAAWFDGGSASAHLEELWENKTELPGWIRAQIPDDYIDAEYADLRTVMAYLADNSLRVCGKCGSTYAKGTGGSGGFAFRKCGECVKSENHCPETPDNSHVFTCLNPSQKRSTRVSTKYKCTACGFRKSTTPTG